MMQWLPSSTENKYSYKLRQKIVISKVSCRVWVNCQIIQYAQTWKSSNLKDLLELYEMIECYLMELCGMISSSSSSSKCSIIVGYCSSWSAWSELPTGSERPHTSFCVTQRPIIDITFQVRIVTQRLQLQILHNYRYYIPGEDCKIKVNMIGRSKV